MSRYANTAAEPPQPTFEGDQGFRGLNMTDARGPLDTGYYANAVNYRIVDDEMHKRNGSIMPAFANVVVFTGGIVGSGIYSAPRGTQQMLIATSSKVYTVTSGGYPTEIALPEGETLSAPIYFEQAFDKVLMLRGLDERPLQWDGTATGNFEFVTKKNPLDTSTVVLPNAERGTAIGARFAVVQNRTDLLLSDIRDYTSVDPILANFPANLGHSDVIVRIYPYARGTFIIGKDNRTELLTNFTDPAHPEQARLDPLSDNVGSVAWGSWAMDRDGVIFLSQTGFYRIREFIEGRNAAFPLVDDEDNPIGPLIKRITWSAAANVVSVFHDPYYVAALPIDGSTVNNCLAWYNTITKEWEAYDTWDPAAGMQIDNLLLFNYLGARRLWAINYASASIHLLEEGKFDITKAGQFEIASILETRGYATLGWNAATRRDFRRAEISVRTWRPSLTVTELTDRANDARLLTQQPYTRNPKKWTAWARPDYDLSNAGGNHGAPHREDYSVDLPATDPITLEGVDPELKQSDVLRFSTQTRARYVSLLIESTQGDADIAGVLLESAGVQRGAPRRTG